MTWAKSDEAKILSYRFARAGVKGFLWGKGFVLQKSVRNLTEGADNSYKPFFLQWGMGYWGERHAGYILVSFSGCQKMSINLMSLFLREGGILKRMPNKKPF
jgi:hypothetical protein